MIDRAVALGVCVGVFAALLQHLHVVRSIRSQTRGPSASPMGKPFMGFVVRVTALALIFVGAAYSGRVSVSVALVTFAAAHLLGMIVLAARISGGAFEKIESGKN